MLGSEVGVGEVSSTFRVRIQTPGGVPGEAPLGTWKFQTNGTYF